MPVDPYLVTFRFCIRQSVRILTLNLQGRVLARGEHPGGLHTYRVIYWAEGHRHDEWLYEHELSEA